MSYSSKFYICNVLWINLSTSSIVSVIRYGGVSVLVESQPHNWILLTLHLIWNSIYLKTYIWITFDFQQLTTEQNYYCFLFRKSNEKLVVQLCTCLLKFHFMLVVFPLPSLKKENNIGKYIYNYKSFLTILW